MELKTMLYDTYTIKSLFIQNAAMLILVAGAGFLLLRAALKRNWRQAVVFGVWVFIVLWFFNSPFFGFSEVSVGKKGIRLNYGLLSVRNTVVPLTSPWKVDIYMSGIRKMKRLYFLEIGGHQSMKVRGPEELKLLETIGRAIEEARKGEGKG